MLTVVNTSPDNILIDLDNTLVDWTHSINLMLGKIFPKLTISRLDKMPKCIRSFILRRVYKRGRIKFWRELRQTPQAVEIFKYLKRHRERNPEVKISICTKMSGLGDQNYEMWGKQDSIDALSRIYQFKFDDVIFVPHTDCKTKHFPKGSCLLMDDYIVNIAAAKLAGHDGVLIQRNWVAYPHFDKY